MTELMLLLTIGTASIALVGYFANRAVFASAKRFPFLRAFDGKGVIAKLNSAAIV